MRCPECGMKECCGADMDPEITRLRAENAELRAQITAHNKCCAGVWVKVEERLPETSNRYTVMVNELFRDGLSGIYTREMSFVRGTWRHQQVNSTNPVVTVTHWWDARLPGEDGE